MERHIEHFGHWLLGCLFEHKRFASRLFEYLARFDFADGRMAWKSGLTSGGHYPDVRDVLMDLRAVRFDLDAGEYILSPEYSYLYGLLQHSRESLLLPARIRSSREMS